MRIPPEQAMIGGDSDCRNAAIHDIFRMVGLSERLGSGVNQIFSNWSTQHWQKPKLYENTVERHGEIFEQTVLELRMVSLVPSETITRLEDLFGEKFNSLSELERLILITADVDQWVNHERIMQLTDEPSRKVTLAFPKLENVGLLVPNGTHKEKFYTLPGVKVATVDEVFKNGSVNDDHFTAPNSSFEYSEVSSEYSKLRNSFIKALNRSTKIHSNECRDVEGRRLIDGLDLPIIDNIEALEDSFRKSLELFTEDIRNKNRVPKDELNLTIFVLCQGHYISLKALAALLGRNPDALRQTYLKPLVNQGMLKFAFPQQKTHELQGYTATNPQPNKPVNE